MPHPARVNRRNEEKGRSMSKSYNRVVEALRAAGVASEPIEMTGETRTAQQAADQAGCHFDQIAKSVILRELESERCYLFLTAGGHRVDLDLASDIAGHRLAQADAQLIRKITGFAIGGVAPIGHMNPITAYMDPRLMEFDVIYGAAGTPRHIFPINPTRLSDIIKVQLRDFVVR